MAVRIQDHREMLQEIGLKHSVQISSHLGEIEQEADTILDQLTAIRAFAFQRDTGAAQESLVELTVALRHLVHHAEFVLPILEQQLDITDKD